RVRHRLVEHELEELVAEVVVVRDVPPGAGEAVTPREARPQLERPAHARVAIGRRVGVTQEELEEADEIVRIPLLRGVRLAAPAHDRALPSPGTNGGLRWNGTRLSHSRTACQWMSAVTCSGMSG